MMVDKRTKWSKSTNKNLLFKTLVNEKTSGKVNT